MVPERYMRRRWEKFWEAVEEKGLALDSLLIINDFHVGDKCFFYMSGFDEGLSSLHRFIWMAKTQRLLCLNSRRI